MDSIIGFLGYVSSTYRDMSPYLKGVHLTLDSLRPYMDQEVWILIGEELNMTKVEGEWEGVEESYKPILVMGVPLLRLDLLTL